MDYLSEVRCSRSHWYQEQTDKLLQRLEKLTTIDAPADEQKKLLEKQVVVWVNDGDVRLCPSCAKSFNLTRRRHHCRLCGAIMCNGCSQFIDYDEARNLLDPSECLNRTVDQISPRQTLSVFGAASSLKNSIRRGSTTSLLSVVNQNKDQTNVRMCFDCKVLIDRKRNQLEEEKSGHSIIQYYSKLRERMEVTEKLVHDFYKICYSFR
jgi:rabenosyn-5